MRLIYVCSPYRGDLPHSRHKRSNNLTKAAIYSRSIAIRGDIPIVPHLYFAPFLNDRSDGDRKLGMAMGAELLSKCDMMYVYGEIISEGMKREIETAERLGIPIIYTREASGNET